MASSAGNAVNDMATDETTKAEQLALLSTSSRAGLRERHKTTDDTNKDMDNPRNNDVLVADSAIDIDAMTKNQLVEQLRQLKLPVSGLKATLRERLRAATQGDDRQRHVEDALTPFSGDATQDVGIWFTSFEETADLCRWTDVQKIIYAKRLLRGSAKLFVNFECRVQSYGALKKAFIKEFGKTLNSRQVHKELSAVSKKSDETYQEYVYRVLELASHTEMELEAKIQYIIDGVKDEEVNKSILYGATTIKELRQRSAQYEIQKSNRGSDSASKDATPVRVDVLRSHNDKKTYKKVNILGKDVTAVIDPGSDLHLIRSSVYVHLGVPPIRHEFTKFNGVGAFNRSTLGRFTADVSIDEMLFTLDIDVVPDDYTGHDLIIGGELSDLAEIRIRRRQTVIKKLNDEESKTTTEDANWAEVLCIGVQDNEEKETKAQVTLDHVKTSRGLSTEEDKGQRREDASDTQGRNTGTPESPLNRKIIKERQPLPLIEDQLDELTDNEVYYVLDLKGGFFHVPLDEDSIRYTAFVTPDGQYEFFMVPFGLCNSPAAFQRHMRAIFKMMKTYLDDVIILTKNKEECLSKLEQVLNTARDYGLRINWRKCKLLVRRVEYLGHIVEAGTVGPSEKKREAVMRFEKPTKRDKLLRKGVKFTFAAEQEQAFEQLKTALTNDPVLKLYKRDAEDNQLHPVYYASWKTVGAEERYSSYELEVLAVIRALRKFRVYLLNIPFRIITDCRAFVQTMSKKDVCLKVAH
ncbi:uncharacterized protein [Temnothorax nylanderi]|uniref:uncharacterized protein n=1 Tax=Temnothorax nylanderi TaxID=102681 RepID=UPI003A872F5F